MNFNKILCSETLHVENLKSLKQGLKCGLDSEDPFSRALNRSKSRMKTNASEGEGQVLFCMNFNHFLAQAGKEEHVLVRCFDTIRPTNMFIE